MAVHETVNQNQLAEVPPGTGKINPANGPITDKSAIEGRESIKVIHLGGRCEHIAVTRKGNENTIKKTGIGATEDKVDITGNHGSGDEHPMLFWSNQFVIFQKPLISDDQILGKGSEKKGILVGNQMAIIDFYHVAGD
jgi:hypothetical protein